MANKTSKGRFLLLRMMKKDFLKAYRQRRFVSAYRILRNEYERHRDAGHDVIFFMVNQSTVTLECKDCPCLNPYPY